MGAKTKNQPQPLVMPSLADYFIPELYRALRPKNKQHDDVPYALKRLKQFADDKKKNLSSKSDLDAQQILQISHIIEFFQIIASIQKLINQIEDELAKASRSVNASSAHDYARLEALYEFLKFWHAASKKVIDALILMIDTATPSVMQTIIHRGYQINWTNKNTQSWLSSRVTTGSLKGIHDQCTNFRDQLKTGIFGNEVIQSLITNPPLSHRVRKIFESFLEWVSNLFHSPSAQEKEFLQVCKPYLSKCTGIYKEAVRSITLFYSNTEEIRRFVKISHNNNKTERFTFSVPNKLKSDFKALFFTDEATTDENGQKTSPTRLHKKDSEQVTKNNLCRFLMSHRRKIKLNSDPHQKSQQYFTVELSVTNTERNFLETALSSATNSSSLAMQQTIYEIFSKRPLQVTRYTEMEKATHTRQSSRLFSPKDSSPAKTLPSRRRLHY